MEGNQTILEPPEPGSAGAQASSGRATERKVMNFAFDKSYWSAGPRDEPNYCSQQTLYDDLGKELLDHSFSGFNACIMACTSPLLFVPPVANGILRWTDWCVVQYHNIGDLAHAVGLGSGKSYRYVLANRDCAPNH